MNNFKKLSVLFILIMSILASGINVFASENSYSQHMAYVNNYYTVRSGPSNYYTVMGSVKNMYVYVLAQENNWYMIDYNIGNGKCKIGYIPKSALPNVTWYIPSTSSIFQYKPLFIANNGEVWSSYIRSERVSIGWAAGNTVVLDYFPNNNSSYIEYTTDAGVLKRGFVYYN